jgi:hypothetical protein
MGLGLRLRDGVVDPPGLFPHLSGQGQAVDEPPDVSRGGVVMLVVMLMVMAVMVTVALMDALLLAADCHPHMGAPDSARPDGIRNHRHPGQSQAVHGVQKGLFPLLAEQLVQGGHEHVPRRPHIALQI